MTDDNGLDVLFVFYFNQFIYGGFSTSRLVFVFLLFEYI